MSKHIVVTAPDDIASDIENLLKHIKSSAVILSELTTEQVALIETYNQRMKINEAFI